MSTYSDLIEESRQHLMTQQPDRINVLDQTIDNAVDSLVLRYEAKGVGEGSHISIDLEDMYVLSTNITGSTTTCTVIRGMNGSTKAAHTADAMVYISPNFSNFRIAKAINRSLEDLSAEGLFQVKPIQLVYTVGVYGYDFDADDVIDIYQVRYNEPGPEQLWRPLRADQYTLNLEADTTDFPSGKQLILKDGGYPSHGVRVSYRAGFSPLVNLADDVLTVSGLHTEAHDIPALGAALRLLYGRDVKRTFMSSQPEPRRQEEVPVGGASQSMRPLLQHYYERINTEQKRLTRKYPPRV